MPFLIPLIPVLTGSITGLAAGLAVGSAMVGGLGYLAKDSDFMKIGGLLGIASLATGIAGAGEVAAADASASTDFGVDPGYEIDASSTDFGVDPGTEVDAQGIVQTGEGVDTSTGVPEQIIEEGSADFGVDPGYPMDSSSAEFGVPDEMKTGITDSGVEYDENGNAMVKNQQADITDPEGRLKGAMENAAPQQDKAQGLLDDLLGKLSTNKQNQAELLRLGGGVLKGLAPDPREDYFKFLKMKWLREQQNMNNIPQIKLRMNA